MGDTELGHTLGLHTFRYNIRLLTSCAMVSDVSVST